MPDLQLDEKRLTQLDGNIKQMISSGASEDDVMKYATDFKTQFEVKKKDGSKISGTNFPITSVSPSQKSAKEALQEGAGLADNSFLRQINASNPLIGVLPKDEGILPSKYKGLEEPSLKEIREGRKEPKQYYNAPLEKGVIFTGDTDMMAPGSKITEEDAKKLPLDVTIKNKFAQDYIEKIRREPTNYEVEGSYFDLSMDPMGGIHLTIAQNAIDQFVSKAAEIGAGAATWLRDNIESTEGLDESNLKDLYAKGGELTQAGKSATWLNDPLGKVVLGLNGIKSDFRGDLQYNGKLPDTMFGRLVSGGIGILPDIAAVTLLPEVEIFEGVGLLVKAGKFFTKKFPLYLGGSRAIGEYGEAREAGETSEEAVGSALEGGVKGYGEGLAMELAGMLSGKATRAAMKPLEKMGITGAKGQITKEGINTITDAIGYGALVPMASTGMEGRMPTADEYIQGVGLSLPFSAMRIYKNARTNAQLNDAVDKIEALQAGISLSNFVDATTPSILEVFNGKETSADFNLRALEFAKKARETTDLKLKQDYIIQSTVAKKAANVKQIAETVVNDKNGFKEFRESNLPDDIKQAFLDKAAEVNKELNPTEQQKTDLGKRITQAETFIDDLTKQMNVETDPVKKVELKYQIDVTNKVLEKQNTDLIDIIAKQAKEREEYNKEEPEEPTKKIRKPSQKKIQKDIDNGNIVSFTYANESEVPEAFKDKITSTGETNDVKFVRVSVPKSVADYELSRAKESIGTKKYIVDGVEVSQSEFEAFQGKPIGTKEIIKADKVTEEVKPTEVEKIPTDLKERGEPIESTLEAERRRSNGERIFAFSEQEGTPVEVTSIKMLRNYTPDQLIAYKPLKEVKTTEVKTEVEEKIEPVVTQKEIKSTANKIRSLKIKLDKNVLQSNVAGVPIAVYNVAIESIARAVEAGETIAKAVKDAIKKYKLDENKEFKLDEFTNGITSKLPESKYKKGDVLDIEESDYKTSTKIIKQNKENFKKNPEAVTPEPQLDKKTGKPKIEVTVGDDGKRNVQVIYKSVPYNLENGALKFVSKDRKKAVDVLANKLVEDYNENKDKPEISAAIGWYGNMRNWFQKNFGANIEMFGQLLAATSARTEVVDNFKQAVDAMRNLSKGKYNELLEDYDNHIKSIKSLSGEQLLKKWQEKNPNKRLSEFNVDDYRRFLVNQYEKVPLRSNGKKFNANSKKVLQALHGNWIEQTEGPKTKNFAGNLTGRSFEATIDVWAARYLRRKIFEGKNKQWRILPQSEGGVQYSMLKSGKMSGDYPFAEEVMKKASDKLGIKADDLQAFLWYLEKDVWDKNNWTNIIGKKKASFEEAAQGIASDRYQAAVTTFRTPEKFDPVKFEQERKSLENEIGKIPGIIISRVNASEGEFRSATDIFLEPTYDVEFTVNKNADISNVITKINEIQAKYEQDATIISRFVDANHPNARPIIEIGLAEPVEKSDIIEDIKKTLSDLDVRGFTIARDRQGKILGVRSQFVPEFEGNVKMEDGLDRFATAFEKINEKYGDNKKISYLSTDFVDSKVKFKENGTTENEQNGGNRSQEQSIQGELSKQETKPTEGVSDASKKQGEQNGGERNRAGDGMVPESEIPGIGEQKTTSKEKVQGIVVNVRKAKIDLSKLSDGGPQSNILGLPVAVYNAALETIALAIESGATLADAIAYAIEKHKLERKEKFNKQELIKQLEEITGEKVNIVKLIRGDLGTEVSPLSGIKNVISEETRTKLGLPSLTIPNLGLKTNNLLEGKRLVDSGEINPEILVDRVLNTTDKAVNTQEAQVMQYYTRQLNTVRNDVISQLANEKLNVTERLDLLGKLGQYSDRLDEVTEANILSGGDWGNVGNIRQDVYDEGYNPVKDKAFIKEIYDGQIPAEIKAQIDKANTERDEALIEMAKREEIIRQQEAQLKIQEIAKKNVGEKVDHKKVRADLLAELKEAKEEHLKDLKDKGIQQMGGINGVILTPKMIKIIGKIGADYVKEGYENLEDVISKVYDDIKGVVPNITKKDIRDTIVLHEATKLEEKAIKTEEEAEKYKKEGVPSKSVSRKIKEKFESDEVWVKSRQRLSNANSKIQQIKSVAYNSKKNTYKKSLLWITKALRAGVLSSYGVVVKLASAIFTGGIIKRIPEQAIGTLYSTIYKGIAEKAPIEGFVYGKSEVKFVKEFLDPKKLAKNTYQILKEGQSDLSKRVGDMIHEDLAEITMPGEQKTKLNKALKMGLKVTDMILSLPGNSHMMIKDPLKRATYYASYENALIWAEKNGWDINDPLVINTIENAAYKRANYEIFLEDNSLNRWFKSEKAKLEAGGEGKATIKAFIDFVIPVSTVPTNIVRRVFSTSPLGLAKGIYQAEVAKKALKKSIDNLERDQADAIMRQLKQGTLGTALWLLGWFGYASYGGIYTKFDPNKKREEGDLLSDEMEINGVKIPKPVQHAVPLEVIQMAATSRRIYENYVDNKGTSTITALTAAAVGSIGGFVEQIPVISAPVLTLESIQDPTKFEKLKEDYKNRLQPRILQQLGVVGDSDEEKFIKKHSSTDNIYKNDLKAYDKNGKQLVVTNDLFFKYREEIAKEEAKRLKYMYDKGAIASNGKLKAFDDLTDEEKRTEITRLKRLATEKIKEKVLNQKTMTMKEAILKSNLQQAREFFEIKYQRVNK